MLYKITPNKKFHKRLDRNVLSKISFFMFCSVLVQSINATEKEAEKKILSATKAKNTNAKDTKEVDIAEEDSNGTDTNKTETNETAKPSDDAADQKDDSTVEDIKSNDSTDSTKAIENKAIENKDTSNKYYSESTVEHEKAEKFAEEAAAEMGEILDVKTPEETDAANETDTDLNSDHAVTQATESDIQATEQSNKALEQATSDKATSDQSVSDQSVSTAAQPSQEQSQTNSDIQAEKDLSAKTSTQNSAQPLSALPESSATASVEASKDKAAAKSKDTSADQAKEETWQTVISGIIADMIANNGEVKAAYLEYKKASALALHDSFGTFLPDQISVAYQTSGKLGGVDMTSDFADKTRNQEKTQVLSMKKELSGNQLMQLGVRSHNVAFAKARFEEMLVKQLSELLPSLLVLIQAAEIENMHELNLSKLERGMRSVRLRADKAIGMAAAADVANADASYELGKSQFIEAKENIRQARKVFFNKVGRDPDTISTKSLALLQDMIVEEINDLNQCPAVKSALHKYRAARASTLGSMVGMMTPSLTANYSTSPGEFNQRMDDRVTIGLSFDIYNATTNKALITNGSDAKQALAQYKFELASMETAQEKYISKKKSFQAQEMALLESVKAAERYALSEERQFEAAYSTNPRESVISPDNMLRAFNQAHDRKLRLLDMQQKKLENQLNYAIISGQLFD